MSNFVNATPHAICLNDGSVFAKTEHLARVSTEFTSFTNGICETVFGNVVGIPPYAEGTYYIVSGMVLAASSRSDLVAPATAHPDTIRNEKGHIVSVPGFTR